MFDGKHVRSIFDSPSVQPITRHARIARLQNRLRDILQATLLSLSDASGLSIQDDPIIKQVSLYYTSSLRSELRDSRATLRGATMWLLPELA